MFMELLLLLLLMLYIFHHYTRNGRIGKLVEAIPGPPPWPLLGNLPSLMGSQDEVWHKFRKLNNDYYPIFKFWTTHEAVVNIRHPDDVEVILSDTENISKSTAYRLLHPWLKTGLLTSTGTKWQHRRKILTPAFHFNVLTKYMNIFIENCEKVVESLKKNCGNGSVQNLMEFTTNHTLNIICESAMGTSLYGLQDTQTKYRNAIHKMGDFLIYRISRPWMRNEWIFKWTKKGREQAAALEILHGFSTRIIRERKEYHDKTKGHFLNQLPTNETNGNEDDAQYFGIRKKRLAMLDLLIASSRNGQIDDDGIQEEVDTFMFEGHDTAAMGLCFALLLLAEHTSIQNRVRQEVNDVLNENGGVFGYSAIQQLSYLEMCIKESLRLYPSVPFISRKLSTDLQLKNYLIPKGTILHIHIYDLHRDPNFWPEPNKFDPDRFMPERIRARHPFSYIPFSAGSRNCIGQRFVMLELKATIAYILQHFTLESVDLAHEVPMLSDLVLRPARPPKIKFIPI